VVTKTNSGSNVSGRERLVALLLAAGLASFYFIFRSQNHPTDAVLYALAADIKDAYPFFHWHHLLYTPLTWTLFKFFRLVGYSGEAFPVMAGLSAVSAAGAAALLYLSLRRLGASVGAALLAGAAAAFSASWWYFAGEAEILTLIALFLTGAVYLLTAPAITYRIVIVLACWLGLGTLCHQAIVLFMPVGSIVVGWERKGRWGKLALFGAAYGFIAMTPYLLIPSFYYHVRGWGEWTKWITHYYWWGDWGHFEGGRWARGFITMLSAMAAGPNPFDAGKNLALGTVVRNYLPAVFVFAGVLGTVGNAARRLWREQKRWFVAAIVWFASFHVFFSWWEPENVEWWIPTTIPLWLLFGLSVPRKGYFRAAVVCTLIGLGVLNFSRSIYPATLPGRNEAEEAARAIVSISNKGDAVLMAHVDANCWIDYLSRHSRTLPPGQPFCDPHPGAAKELVASALHGFPEYTSGGRELYFTDFEWDDPTLYGRAEAGDLRVAFFKMIRTAKAVTVIPFPGGPRVLYRFRRYADEFRDVHIYEAEGLEPSTDRAVLATSGATAAFRVEMLKKGHYVICVQAAGKPAVGIWPVMEVAVDGTRRGGVIVDAPFWRFYEMKCGLAAGFHDIRVSFKNDYFDPASGENRDLLLNRVIIYRLQRR
jgi:hypothetical protein